jgi:Fe-S cluster assembly protein SufD
MTGYQSLRAAGRPEPGFLSNLRQAAAASFEATGLPDRKVEEWRFTNVRGLAETTFETPVPAAAAPDIDGLMIPDAYRLVFVDGRLHPSLSVRDGLPSGATLEGLAEVLDREPERIETELGRTTSMERNPFVALNTAQFTDGAVLQIAPGTVIERPIQLVFVSAGDPRPTMSLPRILVTAGASSQATVSVNHISDSSPSLACPVTEFVLGPGAVVNHNSVVEEGRETTHVAALDVRLARDSAFRSHSFSLGGKLVRNDISATLEGPGADATLNGLYLTSEREHVDNQLRVNHAAPHCTSHQLYKGVLDGASRAVFNGRIVVEQDAQKTDAKQANRNLLLSNSALAYSNPQLEIFADDVRCTHGSTVGRLDEDAIFYLRSRGIDKRSAESLLTYAFAAEIVDSVPTAEVRQRLLNILRTRLPGATGARTSA